VIKSKKAISTTQTIILILILLSSVVTSFLAWNYISQNNHIESGNPYKDQFDPQPNPDPEIPNEEPTEPNEPNIPTEPEQPSEPEPPQPEEPTEPEQPTQPEEPNQPEIPTEPEQPQPPQTQPPNNQTNESETEKVTIGNKAFFYNPQKVNTTRPDLFNQHQFSLFDILVHLDQQNKIELTYHFDESMNTHIIDTINGEPNWWYEIYYSGGWPENNAFRPDHYPWKSVTTLRFYQVPTSRLENIYSTWKEEIQRLENNNKKIIIPEVIILGDSFTKTFEDVEVTAHNLRDDVFQESVITAIDVILSLGDQEKITYDLQWYDDIGSAWIVRSYWVEAIDSDTSQGTCGFVYEAGSLDYVGFRGNHIHLPSDFRILNSPYYVKFFWICI